MGMAPPWMSGSERGQRGDQPASADLRHRQLHPALVDPRRWLRLTRQLLDRGLVDEHEYDGRVTVRAHDRQQPPGADGVAADGSTVPTWLGSGHCGTPANATSETSQRPLTSFSFITMR